MLANSRHAFNTAMIECLPSTLRITRQNGWFWNSVAYQTLSSGQKNSDAP